ncbi:MAG TPA: four-carbon acid sugar kinase family protein [Verrucomicrobiae bacterium]|nr:four-carbon acid sugar kinase family protein [Verrucomicrobiae bacterium]
MKKRQSKSLLLAYYGDDFTGSTDVMESLARAGLRTVLFLEPPTAKQLARFPGLRAFGIAGGSRAMSPAQMERELPDAFKALKASGAPIVHYKTCSTFDSSPTVGSIGKAIELGRRVFGKAPTPLVIGVPVLGRYVVFGNLFARSGLDTEPARLDRHPTMSRHPVTPMDEADLRLHLARQTNLPSELVDVLKLRASGDADSQAKLNGNQRHRKGVGKTSPIVLFDTLDETDLPIIGRRINEYIPAGGQLFCAGSSGIEYALVAFWRQTDLLRGSVNLSPAARTKSRPSATQIITVSGSCSPVTDRQIARAVGAGFVEVACDSRLLADEQRSMTGIRQALEKAHPALQAGKNIIFHTARGPADQRRNGFELSARKSKGQTKTEKLAAAGSSLGRSLALILHYALRDTGARRAVVCGGDTSTHVARAMGVEALEFVAPMTPGGPLCRIHSENEVANGCEIIFKGGQVGRDSFFLDLAKYAAN